MCWSAEVSAFSLFIGLSTSFVLFSIGSISEKILAGYLAFVSLMQGIEYLLWTNQTCNDRHKQTAIAGMTLNLAQPLVLATLVLLLNPKANRNLLLALAGFYMVAIYPSVQQYVSEQELQCTHPQINDPHLVWRWTTLPNEIYYHGSYLFVLCVIAWTGLPNRLYGSLFTVGLLGSYAASRILYERSVFGSMWCWFVNTSPAFLLALRTIL
jgi:hypothetical protein